MEWRDGGDIRWLEARMGPATAVFSTRLGGVSKPPFDGLNLGALTDDEPDSVTENRRRLAAALDLSPDRLAFGRQVHGADLATPDPLKLDEVPEADGQVIAAPGLAGLVFVADCVPVALAGPGAAAILHCGWRGLATDCRHTSSRYAVGSATSGLVGRGVQAVKATHAAIGPSIGPCCYEVGDEVLGAFSGLGEGIVSGRRLDLPEVARRLLCAAGVERVESSGLCTSCEPELFFSHRRDAGRTGRQAGLVWRDGGDR